MLSSVRQPTKMDNKTTTNLSTVTIGLVNQKLTTQGGPRRTKPIRILLDSGSSGCMIHESFTRHLPVVEGGKTSWNTKGGDFVTAGTRKVPFILYEFHKDKVVTWDMHVDTSKRRSTRYDMIIGRDLMQELGMDLLFSSSQVKWDEKIIPMRDPSSLNNNQVMNLMNEIFKQDPIDEEIIARVTAEKYSSADLPQEVSKIEHLSRDEKSDLLTLLNKYKSLFDGTLGTWNTSPVDLELKEGAKPYYGKPYPVPKAQEQKLKDEIQRLINFGVLKQVHESEWGSPAYTIPKKDGITLRSIADLREVNKRIKRKPFPIPKISELLMKLENFQFGTSLDLNMGYYHIELTPEARRICTIVFPWGKYEYTRLPMGLCNSPDIFQAKMGELMYDLEYVRAYIDDLLVISTSTFKDHLEKLEAVFERLQKSGLKVNASKSTFCAHELEYLGFWISREGIRPLNKKVEAITNMGRPRSKRELRRFLGMINHYRDMWLRRSDVLTPLTCLTSKKATFKWTEECQQAFDTMKKIISKGTILAFPDFNKTFHIHTDASNYQMGAVISQDDKPIAFWSKKLNPAQTRYSTTEQELLSIVEVCKEFRTILLGQQIVIHTDHKNLTHKNIALTSNMSKEKRMSLQMLSVT